MLALFMLGFFLGASAGCMAMALALASRDLRSGR